MRTRRLCFFKYTGLLMAVTGHVCSLVTLFLPKWLTFSSDFLERETFMLGLWEACVTQEAGDIMCKAYTTLLELSADIRMARVLMCFAGAAGTLGFLATLPGLTCLRYQGHLGSFFERSLNITGGALFFLAGLTTLVPVSYIAHVTVKKFPPYAPRGGYGSSLFCGWAGAFLLLSGGLLLIMSQLYYHGLAENSASFSPKQHVPRKVPLDKVDNVYCVPQKDGLKC